MTAGVEQTNKAPAIPLAGDTDAFVQINILIKYDPDIRLSTIPARLSAIWRTMRRWYFASLYVSDSLRYHDSRHPPARIPRFSLGSSRRRHLDTFPDGYVRIGVAVKQQERGLDLIGVEQRALLGKELRGVQG